MNEYQHNSSLEPGGGSYNNVYSVGQDRFSGSNDFILINKNTSPISAKSMKSWILKKSQNVCKPKIWYRRLPILYWLPKYNKSSAISDLIAGVTVGLMIIPQSLAYASIAGVPPEYGLYSSFFGSFVYIFFGSCKDVAFGPSAISSLVTAEVVRGQGIEHVVLLCFLTGVLQFLMGALGLGFLIDFVSSPVSSGFTSAAAIIILTSQVRSLLGIDVPQDKGFIETWEDIGGEISNTKIWDAGLGFICIAVLLVLRVVERLRIQPRKEPPLSKCEVLYNTALWLISTARNAILVLVCTICSYLTSRDGKDPPFAIIGSIPSGLPLIRPPEFSYRVTTNGTYVDETFLDMLRELSSGAFVVALLGILEGIAVCKAFANGKSVDATQEFLAIGLCNFANSFVQGFPGTGSLSRSAINNNSGVKTSLGGLYSSILVIISLLFLTPGFYYIPKATLAAVIIVAAMFMVEIKVLKPMWKAKKSDLIPGLATFLGCLLLPLQYGILIGVGLNLLFILYHAARPKISMEEATSPEGSKFFLITPDRCVIFPSVNYVRNLVTKHSMKQYLPVVIDCSYIYGSDYTAATVIKTLTRDFLDRKQPLFFFNLKPSVSSMFDGLSPQGFFVYYNRNEFDDRLKEWSNQYRGVQCY